MNGDSGSRSSRNHHGGRSLISLAARLPSWARDLFNQHRTATSPQALRQVLTALRALVRLLESRLEELEAIEAEQTWNQL